MALKIKSLAKGAMDSSTVKNLYPYPGSTGGVDPGTAVIVKNMRFTNMGTTTALLEVYLSTSDTHTDKRSVLPYQVSLPPGSCLIDDQELTLESTFRIAGKATTANIDFVLSGTERDQ